MTRALVWFRQDLRLADNPALYYATKAHDKVYLLYLHENTLPWHVKGAQRWWLHHSLKSLQQQLHAQQAQLILRQGEASAILPTLCKTLRIDAVYWNQSYEPAVIARDQALQKALTALPLTVHQYNASLLANPWEINTQQGKPYKVFTPFYKKLNHTLTARPLLSAPAIKPTAKQASDTLEDWQLLPHHPDWSRHFHHYWTPSEQAAQQRLHDFLASTINHYQTQRDRPDKLATSRLSPYLHFGQISPWQIWHAVQPLFDQRPQHTESLTQFLRQLAWREFSYHLLYYFPTLPEENFRSGFDAFPWRDNQQALMAWQRGQTGYPLVDAGMHELWHTGYMHNRVRMVVASFLTKDLLIPWQAGAAWFLDTLLDADIANNSAGWQWTAGCGADAAPYFRIINPVRQGQRFDPQGDYVRQWLPTLAKLPTASIQQPWLADANTLKQANVCLGKNYPYPCVDHFAVRKKALEEYEKINHNS